MNFSNVNELPLTLDSNDLSEILGISKGSCYNMLKRKDFPAIKIGKRVLVSRDRFFQWLEQNTRGYES